MGERPSLTGYLNRGWKIFPCHNIVDGRCTCTKGASCENPGKHPRTRNGVKDASGDLEQVKAWHSQFPHANWALACGRESGTFVVDVDLREKGDDSWTQFIAEHLRGEVPDTLTARTGGGGSHLFFEYPRNQDGPRNRVNWLPGVDIRSDGGYVILAPGNHISGGWYEWATDWDKEPAEAPTGLLRAIQSPSTRASGRSGSRGSPFALAPTSRLQETGLRRGERDLGFYRLACRLANEDDADRAVSVMREVWARTEQAPGDEFTWEMVLAKLRLGRAFVLRQRAERDEILRRWVKGLT